MTNHSNKTSSKVGLGVGLAALAAAAAGAYFLYGTEAGKKKRKQVKGWALKAKGEVLEKLEELQDVSQEAYDNIVDGVTKQYKNVKNVDTAELTALVRDLKGHWKNIKKVVEGGKKTKTRGKSKKS